MSPIISKAGTPGTCALADRPRRSSFKRRFRGVVPGTVARLVGIARRGTGQLDLDAPKIGIGVTLRRIVRQQVLGAKFVADFAKGFVEFRERAGIVILAP